MRILLDENMPLDFGERLPGFECSHIELMGLKGTKNGALLQIARSQFDVFITLDRGILFQHNHEGQTLRILIVRVPDSRPETIDSRGPAVLEKLPLLEPGALMELPY